MSSFLIDWRKISFYNTVVEWDPHSLSFCAILSWNFIVFQIIWCKVRGSVYQHYHGPRHLSMACLAFHPIGWKVITLGWSSSKTEVREDEDRLLVWPDTHWMPFLLWPNLNIPVDSKIPQVINWSTYPQASYKGIQEFKIMMAVFFSENSGWLKSEPIIYLQPNLAAGFYLTISVMSNKQNTNNWSQQVFQPLFNIRSLTVIISKWYFKVIQNSRLIFVKLMLNYGDIRLDFIVGAILFELSSMLTFI